jgi:hypothetical protein
VQSVHLASPFPAPVERLVEGPADFGPAGQRTRVLCHTPHGKSTTQFMPIRIQKEDFGPKFGANKATSH